MGGAAPAIRVEGVTKLYRRYGRKSSVGSLKSAVLSGLWARADIAPSSAKTDATQIANGRGRIHPEKYLIS